MSFITWTENENVNVQIIDEQHKKIADLLNELHSTLGTDGDFHPLYLIERLLKNLRIHFDTEENLMKEYKFQYFISHKLEHDRFFTQIENFKTKLENKTERVNLELLKSIKRWLQNHLEINDRKCGKFLYEQGVR